MKFSCIEDCSQCCVEREYYPSKEFGKIGVLILPEEKVKIELFAQNLGIKIQILPRIGVSEFPDKGPERILAYQLMGKDDDGNTCPFLDTATSKRAPHGGYLCKIYNNRPLACSAYPVIETNPLTIDEKCKFCKECGQASSNLDSELISLDKIKTKMNTKEPFVWRYATGVGNPEDKSKIKTGWILEK